MAYQFKESGGFTDWNSLQKCSVKEVCTCYKSDGTTKPCTYGENADCSRCGCSAVAIYRAAFKQYDLPSIFTISSFMV